MQGNKMIPCVVGMNKHGCAIRHPQKAGLTFGIVWGDNGGNMEGTLQEETTNAVRLFLLARRTVTWHNRLAMGPLASVASPSH